MAQVGTRPPSFSTPLPGATLYHPGGKLIVALVFAPFLATSLAAAYFFLQASAIPYWVPAVLVAWGLLAPLFWRMLQTVRLGPTGIAVGRPWQAWREIDWLAVVRIEQHGMRLHVASSQGLRLAFTPTMLHDGGQLRKEFLIAVLKLAPEGALQGPLLEEARRWVLGDEGMGDEPVPHGARPTEPAGIQRMRPRRRWRLCAALAAQLALAGGILALATLPTIPGVSAAGLSVVVAGVCIVAFCWLSQRVLLSDAGLTVQAFPSGNPRGTLWSDVLVLEHTERWSAI